MVRLVPALVSVCLLGALDLSGHHGELRRQAGGAPELGRA